MNYRGAITEDMERLLGLLAPHCSDVETISWLQNAVCDRSQWHKAHGIFDQIRAKTLKAERSHNAKALAQYFFEEICAKTLYNLSGASAPFDADSPYWVFPNALAFARRAGVSAEEVLSCVTVRG